MNSDVTNLHDAFNVAGDTSDPLHDETFSPSYNLTNVAHDPHLKERYQPLATVKFLFQSKTGNLLTAKGIEDVRSIEQRFLKSAGYESRCLLEYKDYRSLPLGFTTIPEADRKVQCAPPKSATNLFYPTLNASETRHYSLYDIYDLNGNGSTMYSISDVTSLMAQGSGYSWFVSRNFTVWNQTSSVLRTQFTFGAPVSPSTDLNDLEKQREAFGAWIITFSEKFATWSTSNVRLLWQGTSITSWEMTALIKRDSLFCIGSVLLVLIWMIFHFRSVVLAFIGMLNILGSIPVGHFVTHIIMGNKYLGLLMTLPIFIILGMGCDDIFVFFDAWRASGTQGSHISNQVETRLDWTYRRAVSSMFVTSLTSAATFFIAAISPVAPIRQFGIAMGTTILANLFLVTTFFPAALLLWHRYLEHRFTWGNSLAALSEMWWKPSDEEAAAAAAAAKARHEEQIHNPTSIIVSMNDVSILQDVKDGEDLPPQPLPELELDKYPYFSKRKKKSGANNALNTSFGGEISSNSKSFNQNSSDISSNDANSPSEAHAEDSDGEASGGSGSAVRVVSTTKTGVKMIIELDEEPLADPWKLNAAGRYFYFTYVPFVYSIRWIVMLVALVLLVLCFAAAFSLQPQRGTPQFFPVGSNLNDFDYLTENVFNLDDSSYAQVDIVFGIQGIDRSKIDLNDPVAVGTTVYDKTFDLSLPSTQEWIIQIFEEAREARVGGEGSAYIANRNMQLHKSFMSAFKAFRLSRGEEFPVQEGSIFWQSLKAWLRSEDGETYQNQLGWTQTEIDWNDQTLLWCSVSLRSAVVPSTAAASELYRFLEAWTGFVVAKNRVAPQGAKNAFATSNDFVWVQNMKALVLQAGWGTFGAVLVALVVLLLVTWNVLVSIYATLSIGMVVMLVVGFFAVAGWDLGIMEFVSLTIVVGISIGFTVHISNAYLMYARHNMLKDKPRVSIVQYAMAEMGSPLISGAITTATAVIMLFFCKITLFSHFGQFLFVNTIASLLTSFFLLVVILMLLGPRGDFGSIQGIISWHKERQRKAKEKKTLKEKLAKDAKKSTLEQFREAHPSQFHIDASSRSSMKVHPSSPLHNNNEVEMDNISSPLRSPSRHLDRSTRGLAVSTSTSNLAGLSVVDSSIGNTSLHTSVSMSDFELDLDDGIDADLKDAIPHFDLDASITARESGKAVRTAAFDVPDYDEEEEEDDSPIRLTPVKSYGLPQPRYDDDDDEDD